MLSWGVYKLLGAALFMLSLFGMGGELAAREKLRLRRAEGFLALLYHVRTQIAAFSIPLPRILSECDEKLLTEIGIDTAAKRRAPLDFKTLLESAKGTLWEDAESVLSSLALVLGRGNRAEDLTYIDLAIEKLEAVCRKAGTESPRRIKLALFLPPLLGGILLCLLI